MMDQLMDKLKVYITYLKEHKKIARAAAVVLIMIVAVVFFGHNGEKEEIPIQLPEETKNTETSELTPEETEQAEIFVDISGQVKKPGVYQITEGTRLFEVIKMAGGLTSDADKDGFNQAEVVSDGEKIVIPAKGEGVDSPISSGTTASGLININTADSTALQEIPGVGPATADKIIAYRNENGRFASKEDIKNVSGIGDKTYEKMKDKITT